MDPYSPDFHGSASCEETAYAFDACLDCHAEDASNDAGGGIEAQSGVLGRLSRGPATGQALGPTDCAVCHGDFEGGDPRARRPARRPRRRRRARARATTCETCHIVPNDFFDPGHALLENGEVDPPPAEVVFGGDALRPEGGDGPTYDEAEQSCANTYCHVANPADSSAERPVPSWADTEPMDCASCHGQPPAEHPGDACGQCHVAVSSGPDELVDTELHLNRAVTFARTETECTTCHGELDDPAPPVDLDGESDPVFSTVGAHQGHIDLRFGLAVPVACNECHLVPVVVSAPGHLDTARPAEVFPDVEGVGELAAARRRNPDLRLRSRHLLRQRVLPRRRREGWRRTRDRDQAGRPRLAGPGAGPGVRYVPRHPPELPRPTCRSRATTSNAASSATRTR
jgi:predicted CxxxxCH...CXXCH cytochrome family protein